jgi:hypothetical protein
MRLVCVGVHGVDVCDKGGRRGSGMDRGLDLDRLVWSRRIWALLCWPAWVRGKIQL